METDTPNLAERFILLKGELRLRIDARGARHGIAGLLDVLIGALLMRVIGLFARLAERRARQQACRDDADVELRRLGAPGSFAAARGVLVCDACVGDEGGMRGCLSRCSNENHGCSAGACPRATLRADAGAGHDGGTSFIAPLGVRTSGFGRFFAKIGLRGWVELRSFCYDTVILSDCCRE